MRLVYTMRKTKVFILGVIMFVLGTMSVQAVCSTEESNSLNSLASNVRVDYEVVKEERELQEGEGYPDGLSEEDREAYRIIEYYVNVYISNITEELYVVVRMDNHDVEETSTTTTYTYADAVDGEITIKIDDLSYVRDFTITVYTSEETGCSDTSLRTLYLTTPRRNSRYEATVCEEASDYYLCYEFLTVDDVGDEDFEYYVNRYISEQNASSTGDDEEETSFSFLTFLKENMVLTVVVIIVVIAAAGVTAVIIIRRRRRIV